MGRHLRHWVEFEGGDAQIRIELRTDDGHVLRLDRRMPAAEYRSLASVEKWCLNEISDEIWSSLDEGIGRAQAALAVRGLRAMTAFPWPVILGVAVGLIVGSGLSLSLVRPTAPATTQEQRVASTADPRGWTRAQLVAWAQSPYLLPTDDAAFVFGAIETLRDDCAVAKAVMILSFVDETVRQAPHVIAARHYLASIDGATARAALERDAPAVGWKAERLLQKYEEVLNP